MDKRDHKFNPSEFEAKWKEEWGKASPFKAIDFDQRKKFYTLVEFPYCSGEGLHIGHAFTNTIMDVVARKKRMDGFNVLHPMGWDSFGLPTENYAVKTGIQPAEITARNTKRFKETNNRLGISYDWEREIDTSNPKYYRWTQWIFLQLFKHGLAYKAETPVGWCPSCKIILANEEIVGGKCERCGTEAEHRMQKQWILKITAYADRLADELDLVDYPDHVKTSQRNWIGKSEGVHLKFQIASQGNRIGEQITVFTTAIDTVFGTTFMVVAPEYAKELLNLIPNENKDTVTNYIESSLKRSELERQTEEKGKTGVKTGLKAINPFNQTEIPIFVADYVLSSYGTGAVMGVPGHDARDYEFAQKNNLPVVLVIKPKDKEIDRDFWEYAEIKTKSDEAIMINSGKYNGTTAKQAKARMTEELVQRKIGEKTVNYHLRDWIFSRQHYWGEPIPIIFCANCAKNNIPSHKFQITNLDGVDYAIIPVSEDQLPVELPKVDKYQPTETGESPLAIIADWINTTCPNCGGPARRETDTMPNWAGSSWYYLAYILKDQINKAGKAVKNIFSENQKLLEYWSPVDIYLGGAEHTTLHLLYSRFWHKFLNDIGIIPGKEPYTSRRQHGVILGEDGFRMSKSRGNIINPEEMIKTFGADALRIYLLFMGPYDSTMPWETTGIEGCYRFLKRVWNLASPSQTRQTSESLERSLYKTIKKVGEDIENMKFNTAIAAMMEFVNAWTTDKNGLSKVDLKKFLLILAPFAPFMTEELWKSLNYAEPNAEQRGNWSIHQQSWPEYDKNLLEGEETIVVAQINGKVRSQLKVLSSESKVQSLIEGLAKKDKRVLKYFENKEIKKVIFVPGKLINFVV